MPTVVFRQFDTAGNVILDLAARTFLTLADIAVAAQTPGSYTLPNIGGTFAWQFAGGNIVPDISLSGNVLSWGAGSAGRLRALVF